MRKHDETVQLSLSYSGTPYRDIIILLVLPHNTN